MPSDNTGLDVLQRAALGGVGEGCLYLGPDEAHLFGHVNDMVDVIEDSTPFLELFYAVMFGYKVRFSIETTKMSFLPQPNLNCHDNWPIGKLVLSHVVVALGSIAEVYGHEIFGADDVTYGGIFAGFLCLCCVAAVSPLIIHGQHCC